MLPGNPELFFRLGILQILHPLDDGVARRLPSFRPRLSRLLAHRRGGAELTLGRRNWRPPDGRSKGALSGGGGYRCQLWLRDPGRRTIHWRRGSTLDCDLRGLWRWLWLWHSCHKLCNPAPIQPSYQNAEKPIPGERNASASAGATKWSVCTDSWQYESGSWGSGHIQPKTSVRDLNLPLIRPWPAGLVPVCRQLE